MEKFKISVLGLCAMSLILLSGCLEKPRFPERLEVTGMVTLDGKPLSHGAITFESKSDAAVGLAGTSAIADGKYKALVLPGEKTVRVNQMFEQGKGINANPVEKIPPQYNKNTTLKATVAEGKTNFDFKLESK